MRVRHLTATLALSALALTGCSGDTDAEETSTSTVKPTVVDPTSSSTSPESSTSSTSEAETDGPPPEAQANTKEGAEAFAEWYAVEMGDVTTDGDTAVLKEFTSPGCEVCLAYQDRVHETAGKYGHVDSNPNRVTVERSAQDERGTWRVKTRVSHERIEYKQDGKVRSFVKPGTYDLNLELSRNDSGWLVADWLFVQ